MLQLKKTTEKTSKRTRKKRDSIRDLTWEKVDGRPFRIKKNCSIATKIFKDNRCEKEKKSPKKNLE